MMGLSPMMGLRMTLAPAQGGGVTAGSGPWLLPQAFEPMPGNPGVLGGVLGIAVA